RLGTWAVPSLRRSMTWMRKLSRRCMADGTLWNRPRVAELFRGPSVRWWIAGGRAARAGAPDRHHEDIDVAVRIDDLDGLRKDLSDWHLWEANSGTLRPLLPGDHLTEGCEQLWARRNAQHPWQL